jgi:3-hydroxyisobutyrate dehydrogenase-like beta-hydroxyacid dehydrogenase
MARVLLAKGFSVYGWNRSPLEAELTAGIPLVASLAEAAVAEVCLLMLSDSDAVEAVLGQLAPHLRSGQLVLDMSSSDPARTKRLADILLSRGIGWVDAPVSGGPEGAAAGSLAIMVGGNDGDVRQVWPILEALGGNVTHVGGPGAGHSVKVINQLIVGLTAQAIAEGLTLAEKSGIDPRLVQQALKGGFADSKMLHIHGTRMINRAYVPGGKVSVQLKDLKLGQAMAKQAGVQLPHLEDMVQRYETLVAQGDADLDQSAVHKLLWQ